MGSGNIFGKFKPFILVGNVHVIQFVMDDSIIVSSKK